MAFRKTLAGLQTSFAESGLYQSFAQNEALSIPESLSSPSMMAASREACIEFRASVLASVPSGVSSALRADVDGDGEEVALCRNDLHDCVAYQHVLDRLQVASGDLVEVSNPDLPSVPARLARIWAAGEGDVLLKEDVKVSPFLAYNIGVPYHLTAFFKGRDSASPEFPVCLRRYVYTHWSSKGDESSRDGKESNGKSDRGGSEEAEGESVLVSNPGEGGPVRIKLAKRVCLRVVREPDPTGDFLPEITEEEEEKKDGLPGGQANGREQVNAGFDDPDEETASVCLDAYFGSDVRVVSLGDVIAIPVPASHVKSPGMAVSHINAEVVRASEEGRGDEAGVCGPEELLYFKVTSVWPRTTGGAGGLEGMGDIGGLSLDEAQAGTWGGLPFVAVDSSLTSVSMDGVTSSGFPVGAKEYIFGSAGGARSEASGRVRRLGWTAQNAPGRDAELEYVGQLLSVWEDVAHVVACTIHPQSTAITMRPSILLHGPNGAGKRTATKAAAAALGCHFVSLSCEDIRPEGMPDDKVVETLDAVMNIAGNYKPVILLLRDIHLLAQPSPMVPNVEAQGARVGAALSRCIVKGLEGQFGEDDETSVISGRHEEGPFPRPIFLIATTSDPDDVEPGIRRCFTHEILADAPDADGRRMLLQSFLSSACDECSIGAEDIDNMVQHTAGLLPVELKNVAAEAYAAAVSGLHAEIPGADSSRDAGQVVPATSTTGATATASVDLPDVDHSHVDRSIVSVRSKTASEIGAPKIPNVEWEDVGGLEEVKLGILDTVELPLKHPELFAGGLRRRSGVLLYGPPGTGKTLLAKAVATECSVNFLSVKGPELINMYVGESERLIREVFTKARRARPCVIFFDELDSLAPGRGKGSDSGGIMDRIVSQLLAEIDSAQGGSGSDDVFIIGATNRPDLLDPALLRPGRLDKLLYVGIASSALDREKVIRALTRKFKLDDSVDLEAVSKACPSRLTGADIYGMCSRAWMRAFKRHVTDHKDRKDQKDQKDQKPAKGGNNSPDDGPASVVVAQEDFLFAARTSNPSLTEEDLAQYQDIRQQTGNKTPGPPSGGGGGGGGPRLPARKKATA